jgi:LPS export ABC transporter protein LptC
MIYWFYMQTKTEPYTATQNKPQEYMDNLQSTKFNILGMPKESIRAQHWEFNPSMGYSDLMQPHVTVYKPNGDIWFLSSQKALAWHKTISGQITKVDMLDGVIIERPEQDQTTPIKMETLALQYTPEQQMITTKEFVNMQQPGLTISGYGLLGYLDRNWIELHDKITTIYTPQ